MASYPVTPDAYGPKALRVTRMLLEIVLLVASFAVVFFMVGLVSWLFRKEFGDASVTMLAELKRIYSSSASGWISVITSLVLFLCLSNRTSHRFNVLLSDDFLMTEGRWSWQHQSLWRNEVEYVRETRGGGLFLRPAGLVVGSKKSEIFIPAGSSNYEQIKNRLLRWIPVIP